MQLLPQDRSTIGYMALVVLLVAGIAIGVALFALQARGPAGSADFMVSSGRSVECTVGSGAPVCYRFDVTNVGAGAGRLECLVVATDGGDAVFTASGTDLYQSDAPVAVGDSYALHTQLRAAGGQKIGRPDVACRAFG